jgi:uncharacterized protein (TIGR03437 family)
MRLAQVTVLIGLAFGQAAMAQTSTTTIAAAPPFDSSGDALLNGTYYFRDISYVAADSMGDLKEASVLYGTLTFDGKGGYTISAKSATLNDSSQPPQQELPATPGTYTISASGYGYVSHPLSPADNIYGLATKLSPYQPGVFVGSATETTNGFNDFFIAAPMPASPATNATLEGTYTVAFMNLPMTNLTPAEFAPSSVYEGYFQFTADGAGVIGTVSLNLFQGDSAKAVTIAEPAVSYSFNNGIASIDFPMDYTLPIWGTEDVFVSPDGNFFFGGSAGLTYDGAAVPGGWDMMIGLRSTPGTSFGGLYYEAGMDEDLSQITATPASAVLDTYYGAFDAVSGESAGSGMIVGDQRILPAGTATPHHRTYTEPYELNPDGTSTEAKTNYATGANGAIRVGYGIGPHLSLSLALQAPSFSSGTSITSGTSVYLSPAGVVNSASFAPFTAGIAPGELITLYGANFTSGTPQTASIQPLPTTLGGAQVTINGTTAPLVYVSATQINAMVPYATVGPVASIQVMNDTLSSNTVTEFVNETDPGVFVEPSGGVWYGAILNADYSPVTSAAPALAGSDVLIYATGLGNVTAAMYPYATTNYPITVSIGGINAPVLYSGTAPGFEGLYQVNVTIPSGVPAGNATLTISGPDSVTMETVIPIE